MKLLTLSPTSTVLLGNNRVISPNIFIGWNYLSVLVSTRLVSQLTNILWPLAWLSEICLPAGHISGYLRTSDWVDINLLHLFDPLNTKKSFLTGWNKMYHKNGLCNFTFVRNNEITQWYLSGFFNYIMSTMVCKRFVISCTKGEGENTSNFNPGLRLCIFVVISGISGYCHDNLRSHQ